MSKSRNAGASARKFLTAAFSATLNVVKTVATVSYEAPRDFVQGLKSGKAVPPVQAISRRRRR